MNDLQEFDIIVYGATGFTGRLVVEYLHQRYGNGGQIRWAMAGRSVEKLVSVRDEIGAPADTPLVVADSNNEAQMTAMVQSTKLVITTVGPFQLYGSELVGLCARHGTDYVDLCGESVWMRQMIDLHQEEAERSGARIVFSCGFDSIPTDLGIFELQRLAKQQLGDVCSRVMGRVRGLQGTFSGGTAASIQVSFAAAKDDPEIYKLAIDHYSLVPESLAKGAPKVEQPNGDQVYYQEELGSWVAPFVMAAINTRNVHRSNALLGHAYGQQFRYDEMMMTGPGEKGQAVAKHVAADRSIAGPDAPKPGEGPSKEEREAGFYDILYIGTTDDGKKISVNVKGDRDPGYGSTSKMIAESAICLIKDCPETQGGIWTTAPAMGSKLIKRLEANAGLSFTQV